MGIIRTPEAEAEANRRSGRAFKDRDLLLDQSEILCMEVINHGNFTQDEARNLLGLVKNIRAETD